MFFKVFSKDRILLRAFLRGIKTEAVRLELTQRFLVTGFQDQGGTNYALYFPITSLRYLNIECKSERFRGFSSPAAFFVSRVGCVVTMIADSCLITSGAQNSSLTHPIIFGNSPSCGFCLSGTFVISVCFRDNIFFLDYNSWGALLVRLIASKDYLDSKCPGGSNKSRAPLATREYFRPRGIPVVPTFLTY